MRRARELFDRIVARDNLSLAFWKAARGRRHRRETVEFARFLDENLAVLGAGLADGSLPSGRCRQFLIHDPKRRLITAPCFFDRVAHHAVMNIVEPVLERWLVD